MDVVVTVTEYKNLLKARGYADNTIRLYRIGLDRFSRYLAGNNIDDLRKVTPQMVEAYRLEVMAGDMAMETKGLRLRPVKRLFEYLLEANRLLINPAETIVEVSRKNKKTGVILTVAEIKKLFAQPNLSVKTHIRDRAIMEVLYSTGIRVNELLLLEIYHADVKDGVLYIRKGKGKKQRVVPL
ncbi:MAG: tyrosine-type recombinase/integrase, partial [bacterium]|nr:tyrosine-type recombinase/integrase [bacterium]